MDDAAAETAPADGEEGSKKRKVCHLVHTSRPSLTPLFSARPQRLPRPSRPQRRLNPPQRRRRAKRSLRTMSMTSSTLSEQPPSRRRYPSECPNTELILAYECTRRQWMLLGRALYPTLFQVICAPDIACSPFLTCFLCWRLCSSLCLGALYYSSYLNQCFQILLS